jgi:hypothetical protein
MPTTLANDGEVGLVYRMDGKSYAVILTRAQHELLQKIVPMIGKIAVDKKREVDFVEVK